ncbi:MAG: hypothetical protein NWF14_08945 [Candidatus Bathyarchaeota archaeon]|nr:hypothetical protein [Candidatus Bathyarchaeota archaeon]
MNEEITIERLQREVELLLLRSGADFVGFADVSDMTFPNNADIRRAISIGIAYDSSIVERLDSDVDAFEKHLNCTRKKMEEILDLCERYLKQKGFITWIPPITKTLPGLLSDFSHKIAATKAGLGWVGKSSLLVSKKYGCGVRLATVLTNAAFTPGKPETVSRCGDCIECVKACTYGAIKGATWYPGIQRDRLLDAFLCSKKRGEYTPVLGHKHPCGLCIKACPVGKKRERSDT